MVLYTQLDVMQLHAAVAVAAITALLQFAAPVRCCCCCTQQGTAAIAAVAATAAEYGL